MEDIKVQYKINDNIIGTANIPKSRVEGLDEAIGTLAIHINGVKDEFGAFKRFAGHDIEQLKKVVEVQVKQKSESKNDAPKSPPRMMENKHSESEKISASHAGSTISDRPVKESLENIDPTPYSY